MKIGILGAGAIASGAAAYLAQNGHEPTLWSPSGRRLGGLGEGAPLTAKGGIEGTFAVSVAANAAEAVSGKDAVLVALPANGHRMVLDAVAPHLVDGQPVIFSSHASFGALYLSRLLAARGVSVPMIVWGTTLTTGRMAGDEAVNVSTLRKKIDYATLGAWDGESAVGLLTELFGDRFVPRDGLMAIALSNLNPQNHLGIALLGCVNTYGRQALRTSRQARENSTCRRRLHGRIRDKQRGRGRACMPHKQFERRCVRQHRPALRVMCM